MEQPQMEDLIAKAQSAAWDNFYEVGGWGMYPTTFFGFLLLLSACIYMFRPERRFLPVVVTTGILTFSAGLVATFSGLKIGFTYVQYVDPGKAAQVAALAVAHASSNIVFALILVILGGMATLKGIIRQTLRRTP